MPRQRITLNNREYRDRLLRLQKLGIPIGCAVDPSPEPERLTLNQIQHEFARLYDLPADQVAVVLPVELRVLVSGLLITDVEMTTSLDECPLDLTQPTEWGYYKDVIAGVHPWLPTVLNHELTTGRPLRPRICEGVIVANGPSSVPRGCPDGKPVTVQLFLTDERYTELCFDFVVRVDRSIKRKYQYLRKFHEVPATPAAATK